MYDKCMQNHAQTQEQEQKVKKTNSRKTKNRTHTSGRGRFSLGFLPRRHTHKTAMPHDEEDAPYTILYIVLKCTK